MYKAINDYEYDSEEELRNPLLPKSTETYSEDTEKADPWFNLRGFVFMLTGMGFMTLSYVVTKIVYQSNQQISAFEVITTRALVQVIFNEVVMKYIQ